MKHFHDPMLQYNSSVNGSEKYYAMYIRIIYKEWILFKVFINKCKPFLLKGASISEIKKQYRALSLKYHPDKGGDEVMFMRIAKAYAA